MGYEIHEFRGSYLSFMGEKWKNLPFLGKTRVLVPVLKVEPVQMDRDQVVLVRVVSGTNTHLQKRVGTDTDQSGTSTDAPSNPIFAYYAL